MTTRVYKTGTAAAVNGGTTVTVTGAVLSALNCAVGSLVVINGNFNFVDSLTDTTHFELALPYQGTTAGSLAYAIYPLTTNEVAATTLNTRTATLLSQISLLNANVPGLFCLFDGVGTADADPGAGLFRFNNATIASATFVYIDNVDAIANSVGPVVDTWGTSTNTNRGTLIVRDATNPANWAIFTVTGATVTGTGYRKVPLTYVAGGGTIANGATITLAFARSGDIGPTAGAGTITNSMLANVAAATVKGSIAGGTPADLTIAQLAALGVAAGTERERLAGNRTYYVRSDGSDGNTGLVNSSGGGFLTLQKAWDTLSGLDCNGFAVTVQVADATYTAGISINKFPIGASGITVQGNSGTPSNVVIGTTSADAVSITVPLACAVMLKDLKLATTTGGSGINHSGVGTFNFQNLVFGAIAGYAINASGSGAKIVATGNYTISGASSAHLIAFLGGSVVISAVTVTISGTPNIGTFAYADRTAVIAAVSNTFSGSATGTRYHADTNGVIYVAGAATTYLPGNAVGVTGSGGQYA